MAMNKDQVQQLANIFKHTFNPDKTQREKATAALTEYESQKGFIPILLQFTSQSEIDSDIRLACAIRFKNLIRLHWQKARNKSKLCDQDKNNIRNNIFKFCIQQTDSKICKQIYHATYVIIQEDFPHDWNNLMMNIGNCFKTAQFQNVFGAANVLLYIFKKYRFYLRKYSDNPIEKIIKDTFPVISQMALQLMNVYNEHNQKQNGNPNDTMLVIMQILKPIWRMWYFATQIDYPEYLKQTEKIDEWMNLFIQFLKIKPPNDLNIKDGNSFNSDSLYAMQEFSKYYSHPFVKARKWVLRCVHRMMHVYGREDFMQDSMKYIARYFMDKYARTFMELIYFGIICSHNNNQFVYFKTLAPAINYMNMSICKAKLFQLLLENNSRHLDNLIFNCLFKIICLTPQDISLWNDNPQEFVKQQFTTLFDEIYDPRQAALKLIHEFVRVRTKETFDKLLKFSQTIITEAAQMITTAKAQGLQPKSSPNKPQPQQQQQSNGHSNNGDNNNNNIISESQLFEMMIKKDGVLTILGNISKLMSEAENGKYEEPLRQLIMTHALPDFTSTYGFLRARACWTVGQYWKLQFSNIEAHKQIAYGCISCLKDNEPPVQINASQAIAKIILNPKTLPHIKPHIPTLLQTYLQIMDDIGMEAFLNIFEKLVDRLDHDIIPYAKALIQKLLQAFKTSHDQIEQYMKLHVDEFEQLTYIPSDIVKQINKINVHKTNNSSNNKDVNNNENDNTLNSNNNNNNNNVSMVNMMRSEEQMRDEAEQYGGTLMGAVECVRTIHTVVFAATSLPRLLIELENLIKPLIETFFNNYFYYQHYVEEILDIIHTFVTYSEPPTQYCWSLCVKTMEGYSVYWNNTQFDRTGMIACAFIEASHKYNMPMTNFMGHDLVDCIVTAMDEASHDNGINVEMFSAVYEMLFSSFRSKDICNIDKYVPTVLQMALEKYEENEESFSDIQGNMLHIIAIVCYYDPALFVQYLVNNGNSFYNVLQTFFKEIQDLTWPTQKVVLFGLSSLFLLKQNQIPKSLQNDDYLKFLLKLCKKLTDLVIWMNYEDGDDPLEKQFKQLKPDYFENESDNDENSKEDDEEEETPDTSPSKDENTDNELNNNNNNNNNIQNTDDNDNESNDEKSDSIIEQNIWGDNDNELLGIDADKDYVNESEINYMRKCHNLNEDDALFNDILQQWQMADENTAIPRTPIDRMNEVMYFNTCLKELGKTFPQVVQKWRSETDNIEMKLLEKYLKQGEEGIKDMKKRAEKRNQEKIEREQQALQAAMAAQKHQQMQQQRQNQNQNINQQQQQMRNGF